MCVCVCICRAGRAVFALFCMKNGLEYSVWQKKAVRDGLKAVEIVEPLSWSFDVCFPSATRQSCPPKETLKAMGI